MEFLFRYVFMLLVELVLICHQ